LSWLLIICLLFIKRCGKNISCQQEPKERSNLFEAVASVGEVCSFRRLLGESDRHPKLAMALSSKG
jgi:hypothetical protein